MFKLKFPELSFYSDAGRAVIENTDHTAWVGGNSLATEHAKFRIVPSQACAGQSARESAVIAGEKRRLLVDEIADVGKDGVVQIDAEQLSAEGSSEVLFEILQHVGRKIGLAPKQAQQGSAIGGTFVVAWQAASRADRQREGDRSRAGLETF